MFIQLILALIVVGVLLYILNTFVPMDAKIKQLVNILIVLAVLVWVLTSLTGYHVHGPRG